MGFIDTADVKKLLEDPTLVSDIAKAVVEDEGAMDDLADDLADDIADELEDVLEDSAELKKQIVDAAMASPDFKKKIIKELVDDIS